MSTAAAEFTQWTRQPEASRLVEVRLDYFCSNNSFLNSLRRRLLTQTGTRLIDWVDTIHVDSIAAIRAAGFDAQDPFEVSGRFHHPGAQLPWVVNSGEPRVVLRVDSVVDFLRAQSILASDDLDGTPVQPLADGIEIFGSGNSTRRSALISNDGGVEVWVIERHGDPGSDVVLGDARTFDLSDYVNAEQQLRLRPRQFSDPVEGLRKTIGLIKPICDALGTDVACDLFFRTEREFWQLRNDAASIQYRAQSLLGFGWANHDHHTYRSSRRCFASLVELLELLGMRCRERFYAGADAGWGAQVLEQPRARIVVFADVDMSADEVLGDFAHEGFAEPTTGENDSRGTVGLWCHLHGEAVLQAGMHHLECQFDFEAARELLAKQGADSLNPFTYFEHLKQSFTRGQIWPVAPANVASALERGWINPEQAERFRLSGVTGSHLEVLERNDGYKGFNQTGISDIIARTDPRNEKMQ